MIIEIDGISIEITRKAIKNLRLRIYPPDGLVKVSAPIKCSHGLITRYLQEKSSWIQMQRQRMQQSCPVKEQPLVTGATVEYQGRKYLAIVHEQNGPTHIQIAGELIHFYLPPKSTEVQRQSLLARWYRQKLMAEIPVLLNRWETIIGVNAAEWGIKRMKTRWGSCNTRARRIWLNLNLIKKPPVCLEYVLVHELVHLLEASHNKRFHALMTQFMPQWPEHQLLLEGKPRRTP